MADMFKCLNFVQGFTSSKDNGNIELFTAQLGYKSSKDYGGVSKDNEFETVLTFELKGNALVHA